MRKSRMLFFRCPLLDAVLPGAYWPSLPCGQVPQVMNDSGIDSLGVAVRLFLSWLRSRLRNKSVFCSALSSCRTQIICIIPKRGSHE